MSRRRSAPFPVERDARVSEPRHRLLRPSAAAYLVVLIVVALGASAYSLRIHGIFGCQALEYQLDRYLAYCNTNKYGDYDHGAFWLGLEPKAIAAAANAEVLFIGNSRMQFGLSAAATADGFEALRIRHYLLGFSHFGNYLFETPLLSKLHPKAAAYVINLDSFFEQVETPPARTVIHDGTAKARYERKRDWQYLHRTLCTYIPAACGNAVAFFREPRTGAWAAAGGRFRSKPVSYNLEPDPKVVEAYVQRGREFLSRLPVRRECTILTMVPTVNTDIGTAKAIASALGRPLVAPELPGLDTFDESHLDRRSAQLWSQAFVEQAGPRIRQCVDEAPVARAASPKH